MNENASGEGRSDPVLAERRHLPMAFVDDVEHPLLDLVDERHLTKALRLTDGDAFGVSDGRGSWRRVRFASAGGSLTVDIDGDVGFEERAVEPITVGFTPVKGERPEWFVQKLTELGVDTIVPLAAERGVVRWDDAKRHKLATRFETTAREAAMQCRRLWLPVIGELTPVSAMARRSALADPDGRPPQSNDRSLAVGPEGGWSAAETEGADLVALPGEVLRAETAVVAAATMLGAARRGWIAGAGMSPTPQPR